MHNNNEMETFKDKKTFFAKTRKQWRKWLEKNHDKEKCVWLIFYKKNSKTKCVEYAEAVEEALCFGWIDSTVYKRDEDSRYQFFSKRKESSNWSMSNKERVERMLKQGLMMPSGQAMIDIAKKSGTWTLMDKVEKLIVPDDMKKLFDKNKKAFKNFQGFTPSARKIILAWIYSAKRPETMKERIRKTVELASRNVTK
jgi:uncharacterized protein YdeI (YjbR/CyaY-like superfamily)